MSGFLKKMKKVLVGLLGLDFELLHQYNQPFPEKGCVRGSSLYPYF
jgi:hypothetical protein